MTEHVEQGPESVHVLMSRVLADLPAIGKNQKNVQQGFMFRGVDDVLNALNPILAKHGVFYVPDVLERIYSQRPTKGGSIMHTVDLHVRYRFYGPKGDYVEASGWGEGTDNGDKATNKAMTGAQKYVLFQVFAISTEEARDQDRDVPEDTVSAPLPDEFAMIAIRKRLAELDPGIKKAIADGWQWGSTKPGHPHPLLAHHYDDAWSFVQNTAQDTYDRRRKHVMAKLAEADVKTEEARHQLVKQATNGQTDSTARLTDAQHAAVMDTINGLLEADKVGA